MSDTLTAPAPTLAPVRTEPPETHPRLSHGGDGDHDRFAHVVKKCEVTEAYVLGQEIEALCGKRWIPSRDPSRYPICPTCLEIAANRPVDGVGQ